MRIALLFAVIAIMCGPLSIGWAEDAPPAAVAAGGPADPAPTAPAVPVIDAALSDRKRMLPTVGRVVYFVLDGARSGEIRPAIITRVNGEGDAQTCNLSVLPDSGNDADEGSVRWVGSASHDQEGMAPGTWHWMPFQLEQAAKGNGAVTELASKFDALLDAFSDVARLRAQVEDLGRRCGYPLQPLA